LEEYITFLRERRHLSFTVNGTAYAVHYLTGESEEIKIPQGCAVSVSRDNTGGIIVTAFQ
jgi:hypothetical protein